MKKVLLLTALIMITGCASYVEITNQERTLEFIEEHNLTKEKSYDIVFEWIAKNFVSANDVVQLKDKENGNIIVQAVGSYPYDVLKTLIMNYNYTLSIKTRDNKIKFEFTTNKLVNTGNYPQKGDLQKVNGYYLSVKDRIMEFMKNYNEDDF